MQALLAQYGAEVVSTLVALGLLYARAWVQSRVARLGVAEVEPLDIPGESKKERVVMRVKALPLGIRPLREHSAGKLVEREHERAKRRRVSRSAG